MATTDSELITEVRGLTDVPTAVMSDSDIQTLIDIGKEELRARFDKSDYTFYSGTKEADRTLFWFTCIAVKVKTGEIAGINLRVADIEAETFSGSQYDWWFENFSNHLHGAEETINDSVGMSKKNLERDDRDYPNSPY